MTSSTPPTTSAADDVPLKVFLDDRRLPPVGWELVRWPAEAIALLATGRVTHLSLDHDLGETGPAARTGYHVVLWLEQMAATDPAFVLPIVTVHTDNPVGRKNMLAGLKAIERHHGRFVDD